MAFESIIFEKEDALAIISLNRPDALNALNGEMVKGLKSALSVAESDGNVRVVILTGRGRAFCAGADLKRFKQDYEHFQDTGEPSTFYDKTVPRILAFFSKPIVAAVNGPAVGVGMTIALACDIRLASDESSFSCPFTRIGLTPEYGSTFFLPRLVGYARAAEWVLAGRTISVQEALSTGLINQVVPAEALMDESKRMARRIASMPEEATLAAKRLLREALDSSLDEVLEKEGKIFQDCQKAKSHYVAVCTVLEEMRKK